MNNIKKTIRSIKKMKNPNYWNTVNSVEFFAFMTKVIIIFPGLIFGIQFWWLYIFALISSIALIWTSTEKTLPSVILFNMAWTILATISIVKHFI